MEPSSRPPTLFRRSRPVDDVLTGGNEFLDLIPQGRDFDRLTEKGAVRLRRDDGAGRARWFFSLTPEGVTALEKAREIQARMWAGVRLRPRSARR